jgi:hypothetical protein
VGSTPESGVHRLTCVGRNAPEPEAELAAGSHHDRVDVVLGVLVICMQPLALVAVVLPPVAMAVGRRRLLLAGLLYLATLGMLAAWFAALNADMDWADRTGGAGSAFAGAGWFLAAMAAAAATVPVTSRRAARRA